MRLANRGLITKVYINSQYIGVILYNKYIKDLKNIANIVLRPLLLKDKSLTLFRHVVFDSFAARVGWAPMLLMNWPVSMRPLDKVDL